MSRQGSCRDQRDPEDDSHPVVTRTRQGGRRFLGTKGDMSGCRDLGRDTNRVATIGFAHPWTPPFRPNSTHTTKPWGGETCMAK
ncbi:hypothetical protein Taro_030648 [Colocasia esculenta]|uniref:Uncharacterized protein n=1 Tax=Colocasia esculenta TaxID=4460 RepID=A0A843VMX9_COLES|nr:hypothetical protein [Colocasia esculenta]